jgi:pimeloyl-ACP methyl ester carboxylesterase
MIKSLLNGEQTMLSTNNWRATVDKDCKGPRIALIHGLLAGGHMQRHLLHFLRQAGYPDCSLYSNHHLPSLIAKDLAQAAKAGRPIVLLGYSQGGSQVIKVAKILKKQHIQCDLVISLAAGGLGRIYPAQWGFNMRHIPANIKRYLNYFAAIDRLGTDRQHDKNFARAESSSTHLENIAYPQSANIDHFSIVSCYPEERIKPEVKSLFLDRLLSELSLLS